MTDPPTAADSMDPWVALDRALRRVEDALASDDGEHRSTDCPGCTVGALSNDLRTALYEYRGWEGPFTHRPGG